MGWSGSYGIKCRESFSGLIAGFEVCSLFLLCFELILLHHWSNIYSSARFSHTASCFELVFTNRW